MRKVSMLLAGAVLGLFGATANAAISVNVQVAQGTGADAGFDIYRLYATIAPGSPETLAGATGLQSAKVTMDVSNPLKVIFTGISGGAAANDADIYGQESSGDASSGNPVDPTTDTANVGTFIRVGPASGAPWAPQYVEGNPGVGVNLVGKNTNNTTTNPAATVVANFGSTKHLRVDGILQADKDTAAISADNSPGKGALFAVVVVPAGTGGHVFGQLAGDAGPISSFDVPLAPEPSTMALVGIGALGLLRRRRQA